jgi:hypothetical protein
LYLGFGACATEADDNQRGIGQRQCRLTNLQKTGFEIPASSASYALILCPASSGIQYFFLISRLICTPQHRMRFVTHSFSFCRSIAETCGWN